MKVRTRARVYDVIGVNLFHCKTMRFHLIKRSFHIYHTTCVRTCSHSFLQGPSHDFRHTAFNRFVLSHFFSQSTLIYDCVCAFCRNNLFFFLHIICCIVKNKSTFPTDDVNAHVQHSIRTRQINHFQRKECNFATP